MSIEVEVFLPSEKEPVDIDGYGVWVSHVAGRDALEQHSLPDHLTISNPKTSMKVEIRRSE